MKTAHSFDDFFKAATGHSPYGWQLRLGEDPECQSRLIDIPTGLGKTAAVVLAWLWNRVHHQNPNWPRRLVYCLPMRTLVEQTAENVEFWLWNTLWANPENEDLRWLCGFDPDEEFGKQETPPTDRMRSPIILMGGEDQSPFKRQWDIWPEKPAILIGTQDMLLSRALNRGYGMSRYRWPMHFALLNNDVLWILDEVQLMGGGLWTSAQLDWMRECRFKPQFAAKTWWMSATLGGEFLDTSDRLSEKIPKPATFHMDPAEMESLVLLKAARPISELKLKPPQKKSTTKKVKSPPTQQSIFIQIADDVGEKHIKGTLSLIVCNRIAIAQDICRALYNQESIQDVSIKLLSSRFRPADREETLRSVIDFESARKAGDPSPGLILVTTQVVEAGIDISATRMWTQLAPWPSIIQRLGRLNRDGRSNDLAQAYVFDFPEDKQDPYASAPYEKDDLKTASTIIESMIALSRAAPDKPIRKIFEQLMTGPLKEKVRKTLEPKQQPYPRALDVHGLFSTEPDIFGGFTDVSPWVRNADTSADVTVFWRDFEEKNNAVNKGDGPGFQRQEGCPVAVYHLQKFLTSRKSVYHWNPKTEQWERIRPNDIRPGMILLLSAKAGGYDIDQGWTGQKGGNLGLVPPPGPFEQHEDEERETEIGAWVPLEEHLIDTEKVSLSIAEGLALTEVSPISRGLIRAAALHDLGKSLESWQNALPEPRSNGIWAKAPYAYSIEIKKGSVPLEDIPQLIVSEYQEVFGFRSFEEVVSHRCGKQLCSFHCRVKLTTAQRQKMEEVFGSPPKLSPFRPGRRHEAASALAMWHRYFREGVTEDYPALAIYLVAAHHGKARTVLAARQHMPVPNVCGIPIPSETPPVSPLPWPPGWQMDFSAAKDGACGEFTEDGTEFLFEFPGWTGLVADLLGGWEKDAPTRTCGAVPENEPAALGPFALAYLETLLRAADGRASRVGQGATLSSLNPKGLSG